MGCAGGGAGEEEGGGDAPCVPAGTEAGLLTEMSGRPGVKSGVDLLRVKIMR